MENFLTKQMRTTLLLTLFCLLIPLISSAKTIELRSGTHKLSELNVERGDVIVFGSIKNQGEDYAHLVIDMPAPDLKTVKGQVSIDVGVYNLNIMSGIDCITPFYMDYTDLGFDDKIKVSNCSCTFSGSGGVVNISGNVLASTLYVANSISVNILDGYIEASVSVNGGTLNINRNPYTGSPTDANMSETSHPLILGGFVNVHDGRLIARYNLPNSSYNSTYQYGDAIYVDSFSSDNSYLDIYGRNGIVTTDGSVRIENYWSNEEDNTCKIVGRHGDAIKNNGFVALNSDITGVFFERVKIYIESETGGHGINTNGYVVIEENCEAIIKSATKDAIHAGASVSVRNSALEAFAGPSYSAITSLNSGVSIRHDEGKNNYPVKLNGCANGIYAPNGDVFINNIFTEVKADGRRKSSLGNSSVKFGYVINSPNIEFEVKGTYKFDHRNATGVGMFSSSATVNGLHRITMPESGTFNGMAFFTADNTASEIGQISRLAIEDAPTLVKVKLPNTDDYYVWCKLPEIFSQYPNAVDTVKWFASDNNCQTWYPLDSYSGKDCEYLPINSIIVGKYVRALLSADIFEGEIYSEPYKVEKLPRTAVPSTTVLYYDSENVMRITSAQTTVEYVVKDSEEISDEDWANAFSPSSDGSYVIPTQLCTVGAVNYIFSRYKETATYYAGPASVTSCYFGTIPTTQSYELVATPVDFEANYDASGRLIVPFNGVVKIEVVPVPVDATDFSGIKRSDWTLNGMDLYGNEACTARFLSSANVTTAYVKMTTAGEASLSTKLTLTVNDRPRIVLRSLSFNVADANGDYISSILIPDMYIPRGTTKYFPIDIQPADYPVENITVSLDKKQEGRTVVSAASGIEQVDGQNMIKVTASPTQLISLTPYVGKLLVGDTEVGEFNVYVTKATLEGLSFSYPTVTLNPGEQMNLASSVVTTPVNAEGYELSWSSSNPDIVSVDENGVVTVTDSDAALGETVEVTVTSGDYSATIIVNVSGEKYNLWIRGAQVNSNNMTDILGDGKVSFDGKETLTITDYKLTNQNSTAIYFIKSELENLTVNVQGSNTVVLGRASTVIEAKNIAFVGDGSLLVRVDYNNCAAAIKATGSVVVTDCVDLNVLALRTVAIDANSLNVFGENAKLTLTASPNTVLLNQFVLGNGYSITPVGIEFGSYSGLDKSTFLLDGAVVNGQEVVISGSDPNFMLMGDANNDSYLMLNDITLTIDEAIGNGPDDFYMILANVYGDRVIDVADVVGVADIVGKDTKHKPSASSAPSMPRYAMRSMVFDNFSDYLSADNVALTAGESKTIEVILNSNVDYTAFMMDLKLPEGISIAGAHLSDRAAFSHSLATFDVEGATRLVSYSMQNAAITAGEGTILTLDLVADSDFGGSGEINVDDIVFTTRDNKNVFMPALAIGVGNVTTGINGVNSIVNGVSVKGNTLVINAANGGEATITTINGISRRVNIAAGINELQLDHGIYIVTVNGESVKVRL